MTWSEEGNLRLFNDGELRNAIGGEFIIYTNADIVGAVDPVVHSGSSLCKVVNSGLMQKTGLSGNTSLTCEFENTESGNFSVEAGAVEFLRYAENDGRLTSGSGSVF